MNINNVTAVGRLVKDPQVNKTKTGLSTCSFTLAVDKIAQEGADWIDCVAWRQSADFLGQYGHKGQECGVEGRIQTRTYTDRDGFKRKVTEVVCRSVQLSNDGRRIRVETQAEPETEISGDDFDTGDASMVTEDDLPF